MISFPCPACNKPLKVKHELAGKTGKCPACGRPLTIPAASDLAASSSNKPRSPAPATGPPPGGGHALPRRPPTPSLHSEARTIPPAADLIGETVSGGDGKAAGDHPKEHYDFLAPPEQPDEIGRLGGFRILKVLGAGGMGVVFQAEDHKLKRKLAIKAMLPALAASDTAKQRFLREAQTAAAIEHDHIVTIHQVGEDRGVPFIAMPFLKGEPLDERLNHEPPLSLADVVRIGRETAEGLAAAHEHGLVHRDIKPANLWLEAPKGRVKILDFGLARAAVDNAQLTQQGAIIGTPAYMAPEQGAGETLDARCDLFSLGCVLYRLCTGQMPFKGKDTVSTLVAVAMDNPKPPAEINADVPPELSDLVMALLAKKPEDRPESAKVVAEALQEIEGQAGAITTQPRTKSRKVKRGGTARMEPTRSYAGQSARRGPRLPWLVGAGGLGLGMVGLLLFLLLRPSDKQASGERKVVPDGNKPVATKPETLPPTFKNSLGMKFALIPAGKFTMGSSPKEIERWIGLYKDMAVQLNAEAPEHEVEITQPFYMGATEVTLGQFRQFVKEKNYQVGDERWLKPGFGQTNDHPVVWISWNNAVDFCTYLSEKEGVIYRLPTEAEWEYCCRAGKAKTSYGFGGEDADLGLYAWYSANSGGKTQPVGKLKENDWGLFDMHGNAWEWCQDWYDANYYKTSPKQNPLGPSAAPGRVIRGGAWFYVPVYCRSAFRYSCVRDHRDHIIGFRVLLVVSSPGGVRVGKEPVASPPPPEKKPEAPPPTFKNSLGMEFVLVPKGKSWLGGGGGKMGDKEVEIPHDFYLGKYEVTQEEWEKVMGSNPSAFKAVAGVSKKDQKHFPVEQVSWEDAQGFLLQLNGRHKEPGWEYRLPKEAEWEYACRGGPMTDKLDSAFDFYFDRPVAQLQAEQANFGQILQGTCKVGSYKPNKLGLHDMHGNVWELCDDEQKDAKGAAHRVFRGGGWSYDSGYCRAAYRHADVSRRNPDLGLRLARVPVGSGAK